MEAKQLQDLAERCEEADKLLNELKLRECIATRCKQARNQLLKVQAEEPPPSCEHTQKTPYYIRRQFRATLAKDIWIAGVQERVIRISMPDTRTRHVYHDLKNNASLLFIELLLKTNSVIPDPTGDVFALACDRIDRNRDSPINTFILQLSKGINPNTRVYQVPIIMYAAKVSAECVEQLIFAGFSDSLIFHCLEKSKDYKISFSGNSEQYYNYTTTKQIKNMLDCKSLDVQVNIKYKNGTSTRGIRLINRSLKGLKNIINNIKEKDFNYKQMLKYFPLPVHEENKNKNNIFHEFILNKKPLCDRFCYRGTKEGFEQHWRELHAENAEGYTPMALAHREGDWNNMRFFLNYQVNSPRQQLHRELLSLSRFE